MTYDAIPNSLLHTNTILTAAVAAALVAPLPLLSGTPSPTHLDGNSLRLGPHYLKESEEGEKEWWRRCVTLLSLRLLMPALLSRQFMKGANSMSGNNDYLFVDIVLSCVTSPTLINSERPVSTTCSGRLLKLV